MKSGVKLYRRPNGLWYGVNEIGQIYGGTLRSALLFAYGYGKDQMAELRYVIACQREKEI